MQERVWRKGNPLKLLLWMYIDIAAMENSMEIPWKTKNGAAIWPSNATPGHIPTENCNSKRYMHPKVLCSLIYNRQDMEAT